MPILSSSGSFNLLAVNPGLIIWTMITFVLVMIVLWLFAWKPIATALDSRNTRIEDDLKKSEDLRKEAESLLKGYESRIDSAHKEVADMLDSARKDAESAKARILAEAQKEASAQRDRATHDIDQIRLKAVKEIQDLAVDISIQLLSRVMKGGLKESEHREIVLQELKNLKSNN
jgi:F-type H+-transporting ATPase subunit b